MGRPSAMSRICWSQLGLSVDTTGTCRADSFLRQTFETRRRARTSDEPAMSRLSQMSVYFETDSSLVRACSIWSYA
jgi:hypothetical protein